MHPEFKALLETVGPKGEFIDTNAARTINPGHCIETAWFIMEEAKLRNWDKDLLDTALTIFDWSWDWGWDKQYGGIINFRDCRNLPPQDYSQDMKFWWPQCETSLPLSMLTLELATRNISIVINALASGHTPTSLIKTILSGMVTYIVMEPLHSLQRVISSKDHSTFHV